MPTKYYRLEDPVENLKIRIIVREVSKASSYDADLDATQQPFYTEAVLSWQEKLYSPREIHDYIVNKDRRASVAAQYEARRYFSTLEGKGLSVQNMISGTMMYTYVDKDHFNVIKPPPLHDASSQEPYLGAALRNTGSSYRDLNERQKALTERLFRDRPFKCMYICLATDVLDTSNTTASPPTTEGAMLSSSLREHILCAIKLYQDGVLEVSPSFSSIVEEDTQSSVGQTGSCMSVFLEDATIEAGLRIGFRLGSFKLRSARGAEYEYVVHNLNNIIIPHQLEVIDKKLGLQNAIKAAENRGIIGAQNWKQDASKKDRTLGIYAEIVSGQSFEGDSFVVTYELVLPQNWTLRTGDLSDGVSNNSDISSSHPSDYGILRGSTHAAMASQPLRTYFRVPLHRPHWRGIQLAYSFVGCGLGESSRLIVGCAFFVVSVFSIIAGPEYPFWIMPALVILFVIGLGPPGGPPQVVLLRNKTTTGVKDHVQNRRNSNDRTSVVLDGMQGLTAVFNHLISFSIDVSDVDSALYASKAPSAHMASLVFQVYSKCWFGRYRLEGYGYHHLSDRPGHEEVEVKTWKPIGGIRDKMQELFLGNSIIFKDNLFVDSLDKTSIALNKFGVQSQSSGSILLRTQTISTDTRLVDDFFREQSEVAVQAEASNKVKKTVDDILKSFRSSSGLPMRSSSSSREALGIAALTPSKQMARRSDDPNKPSVTSILNSLNNANRDKDNRVAEILAKARAKVRGGAVGGGGSTVSTSTSSKGSNVIIQQKPSSEFKPKASLKTMIPQTNSAVLGANIDSPSTPYRDMSTPYDPFIPSSSSGNQSTTLSSSSKDGGDSFAMDPTLQVDRSIRLDRQAIPPIRGLRQPHRYESDPSERVPLSPNTARRSDANDDDGEEAPLLS